MVTSTDRLLKPQYLVPSYPSHPFSPSHQKFYPSTHSSDSIYVSMMMISHHVYCYGTTMSSCSGYCKSFLLGLLTSNLITLLFNISVAANLLLKGRSEEASSVLKGRQWAPLPPEDIFGTLLGLLLSRYLVHLCFVPWDFVLSFPSARNGLSSAPLR